MIVSFCPGRVRLRFRELKNAATAALAKARIGETPGVTAVEVNAITGSVLIEFDTAILPPEKLLETGRRELAQFNIALDLPEGKAD
jgi:copper chaperone CopZ